MLKARPNRRRQRRGFPRSERLLLRVTRASQLLELLLDGGRLDARAVAVPVEVPLDHPFGQESGQPRQRLHHVARIAAAVDLRLWWGESGRRADQRLVDAERVPGKVNEQGVARVLEALEHGLAVLGLLGGGHAVPRLAHVVGASEGSVGGDDERRLVEGGEDGGDADAKVLELHPEAGGVRVARVLRRRVRGEVRHRKLAGDRRVDDEPRLRRRSLAPRPPPPPPPVQQ
mmetsp:Transcript_22254/g.72297  ORF Transcript_22254/g.72297 Transcript_22254/m.72297 type:complete len:230 (+) Transcript_22254:125-814(+)